MYRYILVEYFVLNIYIYILNECYYRNKRFIDCLLRKKNRKKNISLKKGLCKSFSGRNKVNSSIYVD